MHPCEYVYATHVLCPVSALPPQCKTLLSPLLALFAARSIITQDALQGHNTTARHIYTQLPDICG